MSHDVLAPMVEAVRAAARICRAVQADLVAAGTLEKGDRSPVTIADLAAQAVVAERLFAALPDIPLMGEEDASVLRGEDRASTRRAVLERVRTEWADADEGDLLRAIDRGVHPGGPDGRFFTLDPIDGTKGFLRGQHYAIALAVIEDGRERFGVLGCPNLPTPDGDLGIVLIAAQGGGAFRLPIDGPGLSGDPVHVSKETDVAALRFCGSVEKAHSHGGVAEQIADEMGVTAPAVRMDSQCKYALVAQGDAEAYLRIPRDVNRSECLWDHGAGGLIVREAGGIVTDLDGKELDFGRGRRLTANRGIVASSGVFHDRILDAVRTVENA